MTKTIRSISRLRAGLLVGISAITLAAPSPSRAANVAAANAPEEIIVTTRKREESILKAPVIVQAISTKQIQNLHIDSITALTSAAPGVFINSGLAESGVNLAIRGIANSGSNLFGDQSIALNIDGFTSSAGTLYRSGIFDAAQIEVLKGPQSLFYGKSTSAGMIAIHSADPTKDWQTEARIGYEFKADEMDLSGYVSGPLTDTLGVRLAGYHNTSKGFMYNPNPANPVHRQLGEDDNGARLTLKYDNPDNGLRIKFKASYTHDRVNADYPDIEQQVCGNHPNPGTAVFPYDNCTLDTTSWGTFQSKPYSATANFLPGGAGWATNVPFKIFGDGTSYGLTETALGVLSIDYDIMPDITLSSITGLDYIKGVDVGRNLNSVLGQNDIGSVGKFSELSEEVRLTTNWKDRWYNFMIGGLYNPSVRHDELSLTFPSAFFGNDGVTRFETLSDGAFAQVLLTPVDKFELSAGIRYSHVHKAFTNNTIVYANPATPFNNVNIVPLLGPGLASLNENAWTPEVTLTYRPTDDLTAFVSYKKGYKGPAANSNATNGTLDPRGDSPALWKPLVGGEHVKGVEGGIKAQLLDHQVVLNTSGYLYDYKGLQTTFYVVALSTAVLGNGADVRAQGLETSVDFMPKEVPGLTLSAMLNYDDTHYTHFVNASCYGLQTLAQGCYTIPGTTTKGQTLTNRTTFLAPEWVGKVTASYKWDLSEKYTAGISADAQFTSRYYASSDLEPFSQQNSYALVDASVHLSRSDDSWDLALLCRNCTNKIYAVYASDGASVTTQAANVNIGRPLQIMVQLTVHPDLF